jgi:alpha-beta hydrolase superfamily lysophospholipase
MFQERITFETSDRVAIVGDWSLPNAAKRAVLLLHMMPATRVSWLPLSRALNEAGFATLAIDLRGHGESVAQGDKKLNYQNFSDAQHQASRLDVDAAVNFLKSKGFGEENISFVGASIGANLSLDALYRYKGATRAVLLSPGLDYRGVKTDSAMRQLGALQKVWIVAAEGDSYSAESALALQKLQKEIATVTIFHGSAHGTNLFEPEPTLIPQMVQFLGS